MLPVLLLAGMLLSGCASPPPDEQPLVQTPAGEPVATGRLDVVVTDPMLHPLQGATVRVGGLVNVSDAAGVAGFTGLPAGPMLVTVGLEGYRTATSGVQVQPGQRTVAEVKLLASAEPGPAAPTNESRRQQFEMRGYFDCSATYVIITGDCALIVDTVTSNESVGMGTPLGNATNEKFTLDFPLDHGWTSVVGAMHWTASGPASGEQMTFALEPTEWDTGGHAPKYARSEGGSPLRWVVHAGEPHPSAVASADGAEPDMPNAMGGEVVRTRSYVAGQILHRPAGTNFLGIGAAVSQEFEVFVTVFYNERAPEDFSVR